MKRLSVCLALAGAFGILGAQTPPARPQFEVASVKPAADDSGPMGGRFPRMREMMRASRPLGRIPMAGKGRVRIQDWALLDLIAAAYKVRARQVSGPSWLGDQAFDIEAKVPEGTPKEQLNEMLQALLEERFGLKLHRDSRTLSGFALVVGKNGPKLQAAQPDTDLPKDLTPEERQAKAREQMAAMMKRMQENRNNGTPRQGLRTASWNGITTDQLATRLAGFVDGPVVDMTGLAGKYDASVETWNDGPDDPGATIFDAVAKLGLKLEPRKLTVDTLVVDQVSKVPTAN